jgi:hypothetical protein
VSGDGEFGPKPYMKVKINRQDLQDYQDGFDVVRKYHVNPVDPVKINYRQYSFMFDQTGSASGGAVTRHPKPTIGISVKPNNYREVL